MKPDSQLSIAPDGSEHPIPSADEMAAAFAGILQEAERFRAEGRQVVVVQGLGFVGAAVAAVIANALDGEGRPRFFVIGVDLPAASSWWKIAKMNAGQVPIASPDAEFDRLIHQAACVTGNLRATASPEAYRLADVIVVDVHLDVVDRVVRKHTEIQVGLKAFEAAIRAVGRGMRPNALVLVETTVPPRACEEIVLPALNAERELRGIREPVLLAHAYERVMPGPRYIDSIRRFWRTFSGIDTPSRARAREFLSSFIEVDAFPLRELENVTSSELAKILENSYRAANIAFIHEWTRLAESAGIDLWSVVDSIRVRKGTHDNMRYPGFGVGGYCLTKDSLLAQWSATHLIEGDHVLGVTLEAMRINHEMPLHTLDLLAALFPRGLTGVTVAVLGVSYLPDVGDTRNSPTEFFVDALLKTGAKVIAHDPCFTNWEERPKVPFTSDLAACLAESQAAVFAVPHSVYREFDAKILPRRMAIVDANNVLTDATAAELHRAGCRLLGVGKGHWRKQGFHS